MTKVGALRFGTGALLAAVLLIALSQYESRALAGPDMSGDWTSFAVGDISGACANAFFQTGTSLRAEIDCDIVGRGTLEGTIDLATGSFVIEGSPGGILLHVEGSFSPDGQSMEGTWAAPEFGFSGTFTGERGKLVRPTPAPPTVVPRGPPRLPLSPVSTLDHEAEAFRSLQRAVSFNAPAGAPVQLDAPDDGARNSGGGQGGSTLASFAGVGLIGTMLLGFFLRARRA